MRYHGESPLVSQLYHDGLIEAQSVLQSHVFEAALLFARNEGIVPAPESAHAISVGIKEALKAKAEGISKSIVINLSGHGMLDLAAYDSYLNGHAADIEFSDASLQESLKTLP